ncbi:secreted protein [Rhodopirellula maiorica SM1]|uniref:Secreted protein n=1 Tax=Rhodopirellula maiorica SM1 TaxID=1265738 RepID=M5RUS9_9BACT|nr:hypothetical protein [Rhodopirellula maiorica]EMI22946.1 secreted protein [Rhodopirellula maiorica SM1]
MKKYLTLTCAAIVLTAFVVLLHETRPAQAATPKNFVLPDVEMEGTWVFAESSSDTGIPIENPKIVYIEGVPFVVGKRKGRFETFQETMFSGGVTYIRFKSVSLIQQVPDLH